MTDLSDVLGRGDLSGERAVAVNELTQAFDELVEFAGVVSHVGLVDSLTRAARFGRGYGSADAFVGFLVGSLHGKADRHA